MTKEWFSNWFDSPYYHILYQHRDYSEAQLFIDRLTDKLSPNNNAKLLDLACGKGRHSIQLSKKGYQVCGCDLSPQSIKHAKQYENNNLHFFEHDMRDSLDDKYDYIFNLFTSFGYFDNKEDNVKVLKSVHNALSPNGVFVLDFLNPNYVCSNLVDFETQIIDNITFNIKRTFENGFIVKSIEIEDNKNRFNFQEKVQAIHLKDFKALFDNIGMKIVNTFGNYQLNPFNERESERLILIVKKDD